MSPPAPLSISADEDHETTRSNLLATPWTPPRTSLSNGYRNPAFQSSRQSNLSESVIQNAEKLQRRILTTYRKMTVLQRILAGLALVIAGVFGILFLVFNEKIFGWLEPLAEKWKHTTGGWIILWTITFFAAFPPMIGYSTCATTAGFVYGIGEGWLILATATVAGSFCSFLVSRTVLRKYVERMVASDKRFAALALVLKHEGLKLLIMIRFCPLPYSFSNGAMSTIPTVHPAMFALATACITPKLFIHVFIGSRLAAIARSGEKMSAGTKAINYISIAVGGVIGTTVGIYIYRKTLARARELEAEEVQNVQDTVRQGGNLTRQFSDDPEAQVAVQTLAEEADEVDFFDDESAPDVDRYRDTDTEDEDIFKQGDGGADENVGFAGQDK